MLHPRRPAVQATPNTAMRYLNVYGVSPSVLGATTKAIRIYTHQGGMGNCISPHLWGTPNRALPKRNGTGTAIGLWWEGMGVLTSKVRESEFGREVRVLLGDARADVLRRRRWLRLLRLRDGDPRLWFRRRDGLEVRDGRRRGDDRCGRRGNDPRRC